MPPNTVKVDRTTKWGNPFVPGKPAPCGPTKGAIVADRRHAFVLYRSLAPMNEKLIAEAREEGVARGGGGILSVDRDGPGVRLNKAKDAFEKNGFSGA